MKQINFGFLSKEKHVGLHVDGVSQEAFWSVVMQMGPNRLAGLVHVIEIRIMTRSEIGNQLLAMIQRLARI